jgi:hypothetical protein
MKTNRLFYLIGIVVLMLAFASPVFAQEGNVPQSPEGVKVYLPVVTRYTSPYTLSGQIKDAQDLPLSGALVSNGKGGSATTDVNGVFSLKTDPGGQTLTASKDGYTFEPATADLSVSENINNLNFTAMKPADVEWWWGWNCTTSNLLANSDFEGAGGWTISPANNPSVYTTDYSWSGSWSMQSGVPLGIANPFPNQFTTAEFWQPTTSAIPANAIFVRLRMRVLPMSDQRYGYHIAEQATMDAAGPNAPDATESQYAHVRDEGNTKTLKQLFKWFPIDARYWLFRSYDLREFRGDTISILFGAANDGDAHGNTVMYVDDVYLDVCVP